MKLLGSFILSFFFAVCLAKSYENYKVYNLTPKKENLGALMSWEFQEGIDFWSKGGPGRPSKIMVSPEIEDSFMDFLVRNGIGYEMFLDDVESSLQRDRLARIKSRGKRKAMSADNEPNFELFWNFEEMEAYTIQLAQQNPTLVTRDLIGKSIEGRDIFGMRISSGSEFGVKPIIFIDSGVHAREWVGPQATLYLMNQLVTNVTVRDELLAKVDYVIVPNANPDGFVYAWTEDRLWRKNRRYVNASCTGIDLNRNFRYAWKYSPNSCSGSGHSGPYAVSEPEIAALTTYMDQFKFNLRMYLSTHSYGNYLLWPFGFDFDLYVKNWKEHELVGQRWVDTIQAATGTFYELGNSADILYTANGASDDHAVAYANANLAFTLELTGGGRFGFDFPQDRIYDLVKETFLGYREFALYIGDHYNYD